jgi:hypothetical protein
MQRQSGIGKKWAEDILKRGYQADNKNPNVTKAKIWNQKAAVFEEIELSSDNSFKFKGRWRGDMIK